MYFSRLNLQSVRILESADLELLNKINVIKGPNGSGKTSILEALHVLARGKSFRTAKIREVIKRQENHLLVTVCLNTFSNEVHSGIRREPHQTIMKYNGEVVRSLSEQARNIPLLTLTPDSISLFTGLPRERRRWMDWLMFHVEPDYLSHWNQFQKSLRQRNSLLRSGSSDREFAPWESKMSAACELIQSLTENVLHSLQEHFQESLDIYISGTVKFKYLKGWNWEGNYLSYLKENRELHREVGYTSGGPQRADLAYYFDDLSVSKVFSRGQIKMFLLALTLAQAKFIQCYNRDAPVLLLDDVFSELDEDYTKKVIKDLKSKPFQCILTTTQNIKPENEIRVFHVEHGHVKQI